jgi:hypothetical protein
MVVEMTVALGTPVVVLLVVLLWLLAATGVPLLVAVMFGCRLVRVMF